MRAPAAAVVLAGAGMLLTTRLAPAQQAQQTPPPTFRAGVEYVQVDARVVDTRNEPVRGLAQRDFQIFEDGVKQEIASFSPVDIPVPSSGSEFRPRRPSPVELLRPDVASNARQRLEGRVYVVALDDLYIDPDRVPGVRRFLAEFVDRSIGPEDQAAVVSLSHGGTFQNFTGDKAELKSAIGRLSGGKAPSQTVDSAAFDLARRAGLVSGRPDPEPPGGVPAGPVALAKTADARVTQQSLVRLIRALSGMEGRSKAIIFVSEGTPFEMVTNTEGLSLINDLQFTSDLARRSNVPIYPVDPRGLSGLHEESIFVPIVSGSDDTAGSLQKEMSESQRKLRGLADDTGGYAVVGVNDLSAGLDRIVRQSSSYYVLGYYSTNPKHDGKYRKLEVKVNRRDVAVLARHGYMSQPAKEPKAAALPGPPGSSELARAGLNAVLPVAGIALTTTAAAFRESRGRTASVALVLEGAGSELALTDRGGVFSGPLDLLASALQPHGEIAASDQAHLQLSLPAETATRVRRNGFRWLARLNNLKPGRYQLRAVAVSGADTLGSVWYDLEVPDFGDAALAMSDVLMASVSGLQVATLKPDKSMQEALHGPATASRRFPQADGLVVFAEIYDNHSDKSHDVETTVVVRNERGAVVFKSAETQSNRQLAATQGIVRSRTPIELKDLPPGYYQVTVEAHLLQDLGVHASRVVPIQVVGDASR
jgi:VWFA-related protein